MGIIIPATIKQDNYNNEPGPLDNKIDFDEASAAWRMNKWRNPKNKLSIKRFKYVCGINGCKAPPRDHHAVVYRKETTDVNPFMKYEPGPCTKHNKLINKS
jgi:hypothetical protein